MKISKIGRQVYVAMLLFTIGFLGCSVAQAAVGASYQQVVKGIQQDVKMTCSMSDNIFQLQIHYGAVVDNEFSILVEDDGTKATQILMNFMEGTPRCYDSAKAEKYMMLADKQFRTVMFNLFGEHLQCHPDPVLWIRLRRNDLLSLSTKSGTIFTKTFKGKIIQVYRVFIPILHRGFTVVSIS